MKGTGLLGSSVSDSEIQEMKHYFVKAEGEHLTPGIMIKKVFANPTGEEDSEERERA